MAEHNHQEAQQALPGNVELIDSGLSDQSREFRQLYEINPPFDIECAGCCWQFLVKERRYGRADDARKVKFGNANTSCYVDGCQGRAGVHGVVKTRQDINLGGCGPRPLQNYHSYQLYGPPQALSGLAVGVNLTARIEAISMPGLKAKGAEKIQGCYFSYADAALLELYRENGQPNPLPSLRGQCCWPTQEPQQGDQLSTGMSKMKIKAQKH